MLEEFVLGIESNEIRTHAVIMDGMARLVAEGLCHTETSVISAGVSGLEHTREMIRNAVALACASAGLTPGTFGAAFLGLGNLLSESDRRYLREVAASLALAPNGRTEIDIDYRAALAGGLSGRHGMVLTIDNLACCYGRASDGRSWRAGGWSTMADNEGSAPWMGERAIRAAVRAYDHRSQPTRLEKIVREFFSLASMDDLPNRVYALDVNTVDLTRLAVQVAAAAAEGDRASEAIIEEGAEHLAVSALAVARQLGYERGKSELALAGERVKAWPAVQHTLRAAILRRLPACAISIAEQPPAVGAALLALELLD